MMNAALDNDTYEYKVRCTYDTIDETGKTI